MTKQRKARKQMTEEMFQQAKLLLSVGKLSQMEIGEIIGVSDSTISRVNAADSLKQMREQHLEMKRKNLEMKQAKDNLPKFEEQPEQKEESSTNNTPAVKQETESEMVAKNTMFQLSRIADAMERLADAWEKSPEKKKGIFRG